MLEAVLMPDWELRYYSYNATWADGEEMASMRDGSGDDYFILFGAAGAVIKGRAAATPMGRFATEHGRPWPGVLDDLPREFEGFRLEPAFDVPSASFCIWNLREEAVWRVGSIDFPPGSDPDGSERLLKVLDGNPQTYHGWAEAYYERSISLEAVRRIYLVERLSDDLVRLLDPTVDLDRLIGDAAEIGYPR